MFPPRTVRLAEQVLELCRARGLNLVTAESMTGGLVAGALTEVPGASDVVRGGYVLYTDAFKASALGLDEALLSRRGPVSPQVTGALARAARQQAGTDLSLAVTGYASPAPGVNDEEVGQVHLAVAHRDGKMEQEVAAFPGDRGEVRRQAVHAVLALAVRVVEGT